MNKYYNYENIELWDHKLWENRASALYPLSVWMEEQQPFDPAPYDEPVDGLYGDDVKHLPYFDKKTNCLSIPEVVDYWKKRGIHYERRTQGGNGWLVMAPEKCMNDFSVKYPTLIVLNTEDITDPYWAMKALKKYRSYCEAVAEHQDFILILMLPNGVDRSRIFVNILQEAFVFIPGDTDKVFYDVSRIKELGVSLNDIPGFTYVDKNYNPVADADKEITVFPQTGTPVIDVSGRWENRQSLSLNQLTSPTWSSLSYDPEKLIHSEAGKKIAEGYYLEYKYDTAYDPAFMKYWQDMGLSYFHHETDFRRWKALIPTCAFDEPEKKLPVILLLQEVNRAAEHLAVSSASYYYEFYRIAAQGECMIINFVLEDPDSNDLLVDIINEAEKIYPFLDKTRLYITGHSHNGYYSLEFACRHPELIAAVASFGNIPGLHNAGITPITPEKEEILSKHDIPVINLTGYREYSRLHPLSEDASDFRPGFENIWQPKTFAERVKSWQLRLKCSRCPMKTAEEIAATKDSPECAERMLGIPADKSETLWMNGTVAYIADIKNVDGKYHLRIVSEEGLPHNTSPLQQELAWSFMRRFKRDPETHEIIDLY